MKTKIMIGILFSAVAFSAMDYNCALKARDNLMDPFTQKAATYDGERPVELRVKGFKLQVRAVPTAQGRQLTLWLGQDDAHSAVTMAPVGEKHFYLNLVQGEEFAVAECSLK